jgi:type II secretory pathway pseudopilin PulG
MTGGRLAGLAEIPEILAGCPRAEARNQLLGIIERKTVLMVVVLILGILMAIAIPTFLSTTKSAKGVAGESNATNAATSEISTFSTTGTFDSAAYVAGAALLDPALPWDTTAGDQTGPNGKVLVLVGNTYANLATVSATTGNGATATGTIMVLESQASNGECFVVLDDQSNTANPNVGYIVFNAAAGGCPAAPPSAAPGVATTPPTAGSAAKSPLTSLATWPTNWSNYYSNF